MVYDLRAMTHPIINEIKLAQEQVAKQCYKDNLEPNNHVYYHWFLQLENQIKDWVTYQEFKRIGKE